MHEANVWKPILDFGKADFLYVHADHFSSWPAGCKVGRAAARTDPKFHRPSWPYSRTDRQRLLLDPRSLSVEFETPQRLSAAPPYQGGLNRDSYVSQCLGMSSLAGKRCDPPGEMILGAASRLSYLHRRTGRRPFRATSLEARATAESSACPHAQSAIAARAHLRQSTLDTLTVKPSRAFLWFSYTCPRPSLGARSRHAATWRVTTLMSPHDRQR